MILLSLIGKLFETTPQEAEPERILVATLEEFLDKLSQTGTLRAEIDLVRRPWGMDLPELYVYRRVTARTLVGEHVVYVDSEKIPLRRNETGVQREIAYDYVHRMANDLRRNLILVVEKDDREVPLEPLCF